MTAKPRLAIGAALLLHAAAAWPHDLEPPVLSFDGFGTLGVVHSDEEHADFVANSLVVPEGAGHTNAWSAEVDSRLGLQLTAELTPRTSAVGQVVIEQQYDDTYEPEVEWLNLTHEATPDLRLRAGRVVLPIFMASEYRKVGYANPWVRPPQEVYGLIPVSSIDGVDASYRTRLHGVTNTVRATYGRKDVRQVNGGTLEARDGLSVSSTVEQGGATLFAAYSQFRLTAVGLKPLFDSFRETGPAGDDIADRYEIDASRFQIANVGARYDPGEWFVMGEWARLESRTYFGNPHGWYLTGGYRLGSLTPYFSYARSQTDSKSSHPGVGLPRLDYRLNQLLSSAPEQQRVALGARWDFARSAALKVQYEHLDLDDDSAGVLINEQPDFRGGGTANLISATVDFVF